MSRSELETQNGHDWGLPGNFVFLGGISSFGIA
jgi:hypothetical protein